MYLKNEKRMLVFYVYEWFIVRTGEIIYVGKGIGNRYRSKKKNKFLNKLLQMEQCDCRIIAYYETEEEAFEAERKRIIRLKELGQAICNKAIYSTGGTKKWWTTERRKEKSVNNPMKAPEQKLRMSKNNPMKDPLIATKVGLKKRKPIYIGEKVYSCCKEAAPDFGVAPSTILLWVKKGISSKGENCGYIVPKIATDSAPIREEKLDHIIVYDGKEFKTAKQVALYAGVKDPSTILRWCKKGFSPVGTVCRFKDDKNDYVYKKPNKKTRSRPVVVNGIRYESIIEASRETGIPHSTLGHYLNGAKRKPPVDCKYDNQQPSRGKSDNSTPEGSTTNG